MIGGDLERLNEAIGDIRDVPCRVWARSCLGAVELAEHSVELERLAVQFEAIRCATIAAALEAAEGPGQFKALGFRHAVDFIVDGSRCDARDVRRLNRTGTWLLHIPNRLMWPRKHGTSRFGPDKCYSLWLGVDAKSQGVTHHSLGYKLITCNHTPKADQQNCRTGRFSVIPTINGKKQADAAPNASGGWF